MIGVLLCNEGGGRGGKRNGLHGGPELLTVLPTDRLMQYSGNF